MTRARRLLAYLVPYRLAFAGSLLASVITSLLDGLTLALLIPLTRVLFGVPVPDDPGTLVERIVYGTIGVVVGNESAITIPVVVTVVLLVVTAKNLTAYLALYLSVYVEEGVTRDLQSALFDHVQRMDLGFLQRTKGGQLASRLVADVQQARLLLNRGLQSFIGSGVLILVYVAMLFSLSWPLASMTLLAAPAIALAVKPLLVRIAALFGRAVENRGEMTAILTETVAGARLVKAHSAELYERRRFRRQLTDYFNNTLRGQRLALLTHPMSEVFGAVIFALLLVVGMWWSTTGRAPVRPEVFIAFLAVTLRLLPAVKRLAHFPAVAEEALAGADRVLDLLDLPSADLPGPGERPFPGLERGIEFRGVWFAYEEEEWVLRDADFSVECGQLVAVVGPSGAGKSTLVDLLPRFGDPDRGAVLLDGEPTTRFTRESLRAAMGIVSQEPIIFNDSVIANIAYGQDPVAVADRVRQAARLAHADAFIESLPQGYDTILGERGTRLSGGERQRIAIARALLLNPPILIMDEATSSLDAESERLIREALDEVTRNRTVIVIAHRLSTVANADQIIVLDHGRVVECGRHEELLAAGGRYQRLYELAVV